MPNPLRVLYRALVGESSLMQEASALYTQIVAQARTPALYTEHGIPDTLDGRFDAILLHLFLITHQLENDAQQAPFVQALLEVFVHDMDRNLREMGVTDTGVSKRMKAMGAALLGRTSRYRMAIEDANMMSAAIAHNLFRDAPGCDDHAQALAKYAMQAAAQLKTFSIEDIRHGNIRKAFNG